MKKTLYDILEVSRSASPEVIRAAYKSLVQRYHPDKNPDNPEAENLLKLINNAYETLSDPAKRTAYEVMLASEPEEEAPAARQPEAEQPAAESRSEQNFADSWETYQVFIGRNADYYQPHFRKFRVTGKTAPTWNLPGFLLGGAWAAYRKLYGIAALYLAVLIVSMALASVASEVALALFLVIWFGLGLFANAFYFRHVSGKLKQITNTATEPTEILKQAQLAGGVNPMAGYLFAAVPVIGVVASVMLSPTAEKKAPAPAPATETPAPPAEVPEAQTAAPALPPLPEAQPAKPLPEPPPLASVQPEPLPAAKPAPKEVTPPAKEVVAAPKAKPAVKAQPEPRPAPAAPEVLAKVTPPAARAPAAASKYPDLVTAVSFRDRSAVEKMLAEGADVNLVKNNQLPLLVAVKNGDIEMVRLLISRGADVNLTDSTGNSAMMYAKIKSDAKIIEILKNAGAKNPFE